MIRKTIALLVSNLNDLFSNNVASGAISAAEEADVNLIVVPGRYLNFDYSVDNLSQYEYQFNSLFSYIKANNVDAIACAIGTIGYRCDTASKKQFVEMLSSIPVITVAEKTESFPCVKFNNASGISQVIDYLVTECGRKRFAMLSGATSNQDSNERLGAYISSLTKHGIPVDMNKIIYADLSNACRKEADRIVDLYPEIDAVICANDFMAMTLCETIKDRGLTVGKEIAVVGFDNSSEAIKHDPPLSSVAADAERLGYEAIMSAVRLANNERVEDTLVDTQFVPRNSTGTTPDEFGRIVSALDENEGQPTEAAEKIVSILLPMHSFNIPLYEKIKRNIADICVILYGRLLQDDSCYDDCVWLLSRITPDFTESAEQIVTLERTRWFIDAIMTWLKKHTPEKEMLILQFQLDIYQRLTDAIADNTEKRKKREGDNIWLHNFVIRNLLMFDSNTAVNIMYSDILKSIVYLGIDNSMLFTLPKPTEYSINGTLDVPDRVMLKSVQTKFVSSYVPEEEQEIPISDIFRNRFVPDRRMTYFMTPLFSNEIHYGFYLFDLPFDRLETFDTITYQLGAAVKMIDLISSQNNHIMLLSKDNMLLDNISKIDPLTGLLNRRGFNRLAKEVYRSGVVSKKKCLIAFCDMDDLKEVNDRYGHNEGDYALKGIAEILKSAFRSSDVIGRVGGDEFVAVALSENDNMVTAIKDRLEKCTSEFNTISAKPYKISISAGFHFFECSDDVTIEDAIDLADEVLYAQKKLKKKKN